MFEWKRVDSVVGYNAFGAIDPYNDWSFPHIWAAVMAAHPAAWQPRYPLLIRLADNISIQQFADGTIFAPGAPPANWKDVVQVPDVYVRSSEVPTPRYFTALVLKEFIDYFKRTGPHYGTIGRTLKSVIERLCVSRPLLKGTEAFAVPNWPALPPLAGAPERETVVVGVIDDGLPFAHERYRTPEGRTRIEHVWLQDAKANAAAARYGYGRVLSKLGNGADAGIDALLTASTYAGLIDEDEVYRKAGALDFGPRPSGIANRTLSLNAAHGAHVMDLACGYRPGTAPKRPGTHGEDNRPIIAVQLPEATSEGTSGASMDTQVVDAVRFILDKADDIARRRNCGRLPVVINLSHGTIAGRHDGTADIERALDEIIAARAAAGQPVQIVIAAGNHRQKKCRALVHFNGGATGAGAQKQTLKWRVPPDSRAAAHLELWLPEGASAVDRIRISVKPPLGPQSPPFGEDTDHVYVLRDGADPGVAEIRYQFVPMPTNRGVFIITLKPSEPAEDSVTGVLDRSVAPAGLWQVEVENAGFGASARVDAFVQRNDTRFGYFPFGRQSYFEDEHYVGTQENGQIPPADEDLSAIKRSGTLNAIATGNHVIVVGGYYRHSRAIVDYSAEGQTQNPARLGPDAAAPSDDSIVHRGVLAAGTRSGSVVALDGTSIAAPQVTRLVAGLLADGQTADRSAIVALAMACETDPAHAPSRERAGGGRLIFPPIGRPARVE